MGRSTNPETTAEDRRSVGLVCNAATWRRCVTDDVEAELRTRWNFRYAQFDEPSSWSEPPPHDAGKEAALKEFARGLDGLIVSHGAPRVTAAVMDAAPSLRIIGDLEGDRFGHRIDLQAARDRGIACVDTTHGSSWPVAEWALALMQIGLRNAGSLFRRMIAGEVLFRSRTQREEDIGYWNGELSGKTVGLIACGHIGRRLVELLEPFGVDVRAYDPYVPPALADALGVTMTSLPRLLTTCDVVVCLAPLTAETRGLLGPDELELLPPGVVLVNVSRGAVIDAAALVTRLSRGDVVACLDVFDPEPLPGDSPLRSMPNVFVSPHIAGVTAAAGPRFVSLMVEELCRCFAGDATRYDLVPRKPQAT